MYGCSRAGGDLVAVAGLDQLAPVHHGDPVADVADHGQVVRDEEVGDAGALLDLDEQVEHPGLGRQVERRDRLVADDELRVEGERPGDCDALPLTAGELARQPARGIRGKAHLLEQLADPAARLLGGDAARR